MTKGGRKFPRVSVAISNEKNLTGGDVHVPVVSERAKGSQKLAPCRVPWNLDKTFWGQPTCMSSLTEWGAEKKLENPENSSLSLSSTFPEPIRLRVFSLS